MATENGNDAVFYMVSEEEDNWEIPEIEEQEEISSRSEVFISQLQQQLGSIFCLPAAHSWKATGIALYSNIYALVAILVTLLCVILLIFSKRRKKAQQSSKESTLTTRQRLRTASLDVSSAAGRPRTNSMDVSVAMTATPRSRANTDDIAAPLNSTLSTNSLLGPAVSSLLYETWTPPMPWTEASRKLIPQHRKNKPRSERQVVLNIAEGTLVVEDKSDRHLSAPVLQMSVHVKPPVEGAVLELYRKDTPKDEWMEHTFHTAHDAAQFQLDLMAYQLAGESISNMYQAMELIHKGSMAHDGKECVLHDTQGDQAQVRRGAVAWDDAMRCFSGLQPVRRALEEMSLGERSEASDEESGDSPALVQEYSGKRHMLGYVDLFRLFVPELPPRSLPLAESYPARVEKLLRIRKVVAEAAVLVRFYVRARIIINHGWKVMEEEPENYLTRRLAYDSNAENMERDANAKNEYYEATVSRDVQCAVHSSDYLENPRSSALSPYQAFSLVGSHVFRLPPKGQAHSLSHKEDPVVALPSLRNLIESNPDMDFFVVAFFPEGPRIAFVHVFVRSLPKGVDRHFDTNMDRFVNGSVDLRKRKLEVFMQLGPGAGLSSLAWAALKAVSLLFNSSRKGEADIRFESGVDRTPFPGMTLNNYTETNHFGGSLQTDSMGPNNYVAVTSYADVNQMGNTAARLLYQHLEEGALASSIVDFTFVLEGHQEDEFPERAMASIRLVHVDGTKCALAPHITAANHQIEMSQVSSYYLNASLQESPGAAQLQDVSVGERKDPFTDGVNALVDILEGVTVPVRREHLGGRFDSAASLSPEAVPILPPSVKREDIRSAPILDQVTKSDLKRYFIACQCDLKEAAVRVVKSAAWRGLTFPICTRECRIELQSGQFFQQGEDLGGNPVYYFQNMCLGPWRGNEDALVSAVLHRLESSLQRLSVHKPDVKCTLILVMGKPLQKMKKAQRRKKGSDSITESADENKDAASTAADADSESKASVNTEMTAWNPFRMGANPRLYPGEDYTVHSNTSVTNRLIAILRQHYPERLHKALVLPGGLLPMGSSRGYIQSSRTRAKVIILGSASELTHHVSKSELLSIVGGTAHVNPTAFSSD